MIPRKGCAMRSVTLVGVGIALWCAVVAGAQQVGQPASPKVEGPVLYVRGNIYTMEASRPRAEAMVVDGGKVVAIGSDW